MTVITARYLEAELNRIAYFILLADFFEQHKKQLQTEAGWGAPTLKAIEALPIEWEGEPELSGFKKNLKYSPYPIAMDVKLRGKLNGEPVLINMKREAGHSGGFNASVEYKGKTFKKITNRNKLTSLINGFASGEASPEEIKLDILEKHIKTPGSSKAEWMTHIEKSFLSDLSEQRDVFITDWYKGNIRMRMLVNDPEGEEIEEIEKKLKEHGNYIPESISNYLKSYLKAKGADTSKLEVSYKIKPISYNKYKGIGMEFTIK